MRLIVRGQTINEHFQDDHCGRNLGYWNGTILAILNFYITPIPPTKFQISLTYDSGGYIENGQS